MIVNLIEVINNRTDDKDAAICARAGCFTSTRYYIKQFHWRFPHRLNWTWVLRNNFTNSNSSQLLSQQWTGFAHNADHLKKRSSVETSFARGTLLCWLVLSYVNRNDTIIQGIVPVTRTIINKAPWNADDLSTHGLQNNKFFYNSREVN